MAINPTGKHLKVHIYAIVRTACTEGGSVQVMIEMLADYASNRGAGLGRWFGHPFRYHHGHVTRFFVVIHDRVYPCAGTFLPRFGRLYQGRHRLGAAHGDCRQQSIRREYCH